MSQKVQVQGYRISATATGRSFRGTDASAFSSKSIMRMPGVCLLLIFLNDSSLLDSFRHKMITAAGVSNSHYQCLVQMDGLQLVRILRTDGTLTRCL